MIDSLLRAYAALSLSDILWVALYWVPSAVCAFGYILRTWTNYQEDILRRGWGGYYEPTDTRFDIIGRLVLTATPAVSLFAAVFDVAPPLLSSAISRVYDFLETPIVPKRKPQQDQK